MPKTIASELFYEGRIFDLRIDTIREGDIEYKREVVVHRGSAVIVPVFEDGTVALVRQYRHAAEKYLLEIPAGSLERDEDPKTCAHRELEEEIGYKAENLELISEFYVSPGFLTEKMFVFLANGLTKTKQNLEIDELIEIERLPLSKALALIHNGQIEDAKTIIGLTTATTRIAEARVAEASTLQKPAR
jgi:ADP-ribose pyrophosphatase